MKIIPITQQQQQKSPNFKALVVTAKTSPIIDGSPLLCLPFSKLPYKRRNLIDGRNEIYVIFTKQGSKAEKELNKTLLQGKGKSVSPSTVRYYEKITNLYIVNSTPGEKTQENSLRLKKACGRIPAKPEIK